jgi:type VI secretion system protein ImpE
MSNASAAEQALHDGDALKALQLLIAQVRVQPQDAKLRVFLFQLMCVLGQWERALNQLNTALELDAAILPMVQTYRTAIACEALRTEVFAGRKAPLLFGEPETWTALLIEALLREGVGDAAAGQALREQSLQLAPTTAGQINGEAFSWVADADTRLGPCLEVILNGKYYWLPFERLSTVTLEAPADLRDAVWMPATLEFTNGGSSVALLPVRYPGTDLAAGSLLSLSRATDWLETAPGSYRGLGQRVLTTDTSDLGLMDLRSLVLTVSGVTPTQVDHQTAD